MSNSIVLTTDIPQNIPSSSADTKDYNTNVVSPALSFGVAPSLPQTPQVIPRHRNKDYNHNNNNKKIKSESSSSASTRSSRSNNDDDEFKNFVLLPSSDSQNSNLDETSNNNNSNNNNIDDKYCQDENDDDESAVTSVAAVKKYQDVHKHPDSNRQTILPAKRLNGFHALGFGLSAALTALVTSKLSIFGSSSSSSPAFGWKSMLKFSSIFTGISLGVWTSFLLVRWNYFMYPKQVQNEPLKEIYKNQPDFVPFDRRILLSATQIARDLREGKYTSVEICNLFIDHIEKYNDKHINTICFRRYGTALKEAANCDNILQDWRRRRRNNHLHGHLRSCCDDDDDATNNNDLDLLPPFFGVPCTVKESFQLVGARCTSGHPARVGYLIEDEEEQSPAVTRYQKVAGAVILCTTNCSELCMWLESYSVEELHGTTCNPYDSRCVVGGSTGGEAAAISSLFAPFGLGGDFGGSLRLPSFFCGIFTHKPSTRLTPNQLQYPSSKTFGNLMSCTGPLCRNVEDLYPLVQILQEGGNGLDVADDGFFELHKEKFPHCPRIPNNNSNNNEISMVIPQHKDNFASLTIYVCEDLNLPFVTVDPQQKRATRVVCEEFAKKTGATLHFVDFSKPETVPPGFERFSQAIALWTACSSAQPVSYVKLLQNKKHLPLDKNFKEQHDDSLDQSPNGYSYSVFGEMLKWLLGISNHTFPSIALGIVETVLHAFVPDDDNGKFIQLARDLTKQIGEEVLGDDAVLVCPTYTKPAPHHHALELLSPDFAYCALFNALQLPSTQVPVWLDSDSENNNNNENQNRQKLPLGLQIVSKWGNDLLSLQVANGFAKETPFVYHKVPEWM